MDRVFFTWANALNAEHPSIMAAARINEVLMVVVWCMVGCCSRLWLWLGSFSLTSMDCLALSPPISPLSADSDSQVSFVQVTGRYVIISFD